MRLDPFFSCLLLLTICWSAYHFFSIKDRVHQRQQANDSYPRTSSVIFWSCLVAAISLVLQKNKRMQHAVLKKLHINALTTPPFRWGAQVYSLKQSRFAEMSIKAVYFFLLTGTAFVFLYKESWWPTLLGGSGGEAALFTDHPFQESHRFTHWYFYISAGYHLSCFLSLMLAPRLPDFFETLLLCVCGLLLIFFSYLGNFLRVGSIILFCHDFCDIFSCGCKVFVDTRHKVVTFCLFACLVVSWGYLRLYTFPVATLFPIFKNVKDRKLTAEHEGWGFFVFLLLTLFVMNIYWFGLMLKMCLHFFTSGQMSDLHTPVPGASEEQELPPAKQKESHISSISRTTGGSRSSQKGESNNSNSESARFVESTQGGWHWFGGRVSQQTTEDKGTFTKEAQQAGTAKIITAYGRRNTSSCNGSSHTIGSSSPGASTRSTSRTAGGTTASTADVRKGFFNTSSPQQHEVADANEDRKKIKERKKAPCYTKADPEETEGELLACSSRSTSHLVETSARTARKLLAKAHA